MALRNVHGALIVSTNGSPVSINGRHVSIKDMDKAERGLHAAN